MADRNEVENRILKLLDEIWEIYTEYNPKGETLLLGCNNRTVYAFNAYWKEDESHPLNGYRRRDELGG